MNADDPTKPSNPSSSPSPGPSASPAGDSAEDALRFSVASSAPLNSPLGPQDAFERPALAASDAAVDASGVLLHRPTAEDRSAARPLAKRIASLWTFGVLLRTALLCGIVGTVETLWLSEQEWWPLFPYALTGVFFLLSGVLGLVLVPIAYRNWGWGLREVDVLIRFGVFVHIQRAVPRPRIQHVDIRSGPIERFFGLCSVTMYTAGSGFADATIPGITAEEADWLREQLMQTVEVPEDEDQDFAFGPALEAPAEPHS